MKKLAKKPFLLLIKFYQKVLSPDQGYIGKIFNLRPTCGMYPTCSEYMYQSIDKYGVFIGVFKGIRRILRCHPYQKNMIDKP